MAGPHADDKKRARIWMARATIYSASDQGEQVAPNLFDCLIELPSCVSILLDRCCSVISDRLTMK